MPRMGRIALRNYPHHVVRRAHNRQVVFAVDEDYQRYLIDLRELKDAFWVKVRPYFPTTGYVHPLLTLRCWLEEATQCTVRPASSWSEKSYED